MPAGGPGDRRVLQPVPDRAWRAPERPPRLCGRQALCRQALHARSDPAGPNARVPDDEARNRAGCSTACSSASVSALSCWASWSSASARSRTRAMTPVALRGLFRAGRPRRDYHEVVKAFANLLRQSTPTTPLTASKSAGASSSRPSCRRHHQRNRSARPTATQAAKPKAASSTEEAAASSSTSPPQRRAATDPNPRVDKTAARIQDPVRNRNPLKSPSTPEEDCGQNV